MILLWKSAPPAEAKTSAGATHNDVTLPPSGGVELWQINCNQDLFRLFIHEHLDQPLKSEKFSFPNQKHI